MKKDFYLMAAACAMLFAGCSSESDPVPNSSGEKTAKMELNLTGSATRATGTELPGDTGAENKINTVAVGVFNSDGSTNTIAEFTSGQVTAKTGIVNCSPATSCSVIVVANAPSGTFAGVTTRTAFVAKTVQLSQTNNSGAQENTNLPMSAEQTSVDLTAGATNTVTMQLSRLVSRISIADIKADFDPNGQYKDATFTATGIFLYNAKSTSTVDPGSPTTTSLITGEDAGNEYLLNTLDQSITSTSYTTPYWFYTFVNDATNPTKLVIKGTFDADGAGASSEETVYYPVVVNKNQTGTTNDGSGDATITRNLAYKIGVTIKGKGVASPATDIEPAALTVNVQVADWTLIVTQDVIFD
ncbi:fimbrial protein [uncultured Bacteroides sp.]|uniref:fimbrial protein n=1 Tax=uncultured Bacteroides sp. TaxID=162156 RepID=UPI002AAA8D5C|nr:fimbrial protein [uncultured Bacteroides sp.]